MTSKERFLAVLNLEQPDRVPYYDFLFCQELFEKVIGRRPDVYNAKDAVECARKLGLDAIWVPTNAFSGYTCNISEDGIYTDEWGTVFKKDDTSWPIDAPIEYPIKNRDDLKNYIAPDPYANGRIDDVKYGVELANNEIAVIGGISGPLTTAWFLMGVDNISFMLYDDPEFVEEVFKISNRFNIEIAKRIIDEGNVDAVIISEDLGYDHGTFFSPEHIKKYIFPYHRELIDLIHSKNKKVILHCDGNINKIFGDIVDLGYDAIHPLEKKSNMNLKDIKENYGHKICLIGNVDSSVTLPYGTVEETEKETIECIKYGAKNGGYVLASDHSLHDGIKFDNVFKMIDTVKKYGKYPIDFENLG